MSSRWEIPPYPDAGTRTPGPVYRAVGIALSAWEDFELNLPRLLGAFTEVPAIKAIHDPSYTDAPRFVDRINVVEHAAETYFKRHCNQALESEFAHLASEAVLASRRRNDIAHGVVRSTINIKAYRREEYLLAPATYKAARFDEHGFPAFLYSSEIILSFARGFRSMQDPAMTLCVKVVRARAGLPY